MPDKTLTCVDCGNKFKFSAEEQRFMISGDFKNRSDVKIAASNAKENDRGSRGFGDR